MPLLPLTHPTVLHSLIQRMTDFCDHKRELVAFTRDHLDLQKEPGLRDWARRVTIPGIFAVAQERYSARATHHHKRGRTQRTEPPLDDNLPLLRRLGDRVTFDLGPGRLKDVVHESIAVYLHEDAVKFYRSLDSADIAQQSHLALLRRLSRRRLHPRSKVARLKTFLHRFNFCSAWKQWDKMQHRQHAEQEHMTLKLPTARRRSKPMQYGQHVEEDHWAIALQMQDAADFREDAPTVDKPLDCTDDVIQLFQKIGLSQNSPEFKIFWACRMEGRPRAEVAEELHMNEGTLKSKLSRLLTALRPHAARLLRSD
jgi:DNA-directed RNA polymerase specialized sigma24 family protein